ncbi:MAG: hypothetical protein A2008_12775 [Candidatus Wallbacteria bacterium GWC2_49_35]|uniref:bis(5'-nucleosyl)-tetraphosphatase (symmetrical) n=1 Tax=Candidatus Wallbacteria bacterium GWC2_49_35 TaxID=1817813 RepID=A0A1F7WF13_9BACT|nr:MAG: hypothetical protein A2008_12775 [Candidatus Wallbacteria bacterium GWC2_49_35]HBC75773.1 hypothetical protein [Candidatus Wallbacteria bacterium]
MNDARFSALRKKIIKHLKESLGPRLFAHCLGVEAAAVQIAAASSNHFLIKSCSIAGLLHDASKCLTLFEMQNAAAASGFKIRTAVLEKEGLLHGHVSAVIARRVFGIADVRIISAIRHHTLGRPKMNALEKIIFISDYIEPMRNFEGIETLRRKVYEALFSDGLDHALLLVVRDKIRSLTQLKIDLEKTLPEIEKSLAEKLNM